jgi:hypothetical protein
MIRQAHTYLVGALSGVVVIGIAIAAFVVLVSAQVFHDLPIPALSSSDQKAAAVSEGKALTSPDRRAVATTGSVSTGTTQPNHTTANANAAGGGQPGAAKSQPRARHQATAATPTGDATGPAEVVEAAPSTSTETGNAGSTSGGGNTGGSHSSQPSSNPQPSSAPTSGNAGGGNTTSTSGSSGNSGANSGTPTPTSGSGGNGGGATGTSGGGSTSTSPPAIPVTTAKPSEAITEAVNGTVGTVDEAVGGTLSETGVTHVTEEVVNGVAGPESVIGKTVDGVGEVVGGLLGGHGE